MRTRLNPWPATTDLFSSLAAATFGALMLYMSVEAKGTALRYEADQLRDRVKQELAKTAGARAPRDCGEDVCVDIDVQFALNQSEILPTYEANLRRLARNLKGAVQPRDRRFVELTIEGHTDSTVPAHSRSQRDRLLYNWKLSSDRAISVLHLFHQEGVRSPEYHILAVGYADSEPLPCSAPREVCNAQNRRTTFRIRIDTARMQATTR